MGTWTFLKWPWGFPKAITRLLVLEVRKQGLDLSGSFFLEFSTPDKPDP